MKFFLFFFFSVLGLIIAQAQTISVYDATATYKAGDVVLPITENGTCGCVDITWRPKLVNSKIVSCKKKDMSPKKPKPIAQPTTPKGDVANHKDPMVDLLKNDVNDLKSDMVTVKGDISDINEKLDASNLKPTADMVTPNPNVDKEQTNYSGNFVFPPKEDVKTDTNINIYDLDVYLFGGYDMVSNPAFDSKNLWNAGVGVEFRVNGMCLIDTVKRDKNYSLYQKTHLFLGADGQIGFGKNYGLDDSYSAWDKPLKNLNGLKFKGGIGYQVIPLARVYLGYGISPNKDLPGQGILAGVSIGKGKFPFILQAEVSYKHCIEFGVKAKFNLNVL